MGTVRASASAPSPTSVPQSRPTGAAQQQQALPSLTPAAAQQAPVFQTEPPFPPFPPSPINNTVMLDFDANLIADARLIRTFPLSQVEMNALEIEHRGAWNLYSSQRYMEAFESFSRSSSYRGNYLSPYWAGMSALKLRNIQSATAWFNRALEINPYFQPARNAKLNAAQYIAQSSQPQPKAQPAKKPVRRAPRKRR
jgi:tetratricopeptide (TPR) repeat protein